MAHRGGLFGGKMFNGRIAGGLASRCVDDHMPRVAVREGAMVSRILPASITHSEMSNALRAPMRSTVAPRKSIASVIPAV